jgi:pyruvate kinase
MQQVPILDDPYVSGYVRATMSKRTKIVATVGPASGSRETLRELVQAGVDVFRINFSHGHEQQRSAFLEKIRSVEHELGLPIAVCGDLCGPKIRVGMMPDDGVTLENGSEIVIQREPLIGSATRISTTLPELVDVVQVGHRILLFDGRLKFEVTAVHPPDDITCRVVVGGRLSSGKGVNVPDTSLQISALTEKDREDLDWISERDFDFVALSFVQAADNVRELQNLLEERGSRAQTIAKIEKPRALEHIDEIIEAADAIMIARGDLGVEMDYPLVPINQKLIALKCQQAAKPCIVATEMLESMINSPRPTRAEVSDVANAVFDHADAVMLSAESAIGKYPVQAVQAMSRTLDAADGFHNEHGSVIRVTVTEPRVTAALAASIRKFMEIEPVAAVAVLTDTGRTARIIAKSRIGCPVLALSAEIESVRRACLYHGVIPRLVDDTSDFDHLRELAFSYAKELSIAQPGDRMIVLAAHPIGVAGRTNALFVESVE